MRKLWLLTVLLVAPAYGATLDDFTWRWPHEPNVYDLSERAVVGAKSEFEAWRATTGQRIRDKIEAVPIPEITGVVVEAGASRAGYRTRNVVVDLAKGLGAVPLLLWPLLRPAHRHTPPITPPRAHIVLPGKPIWLGDSNTEGMWWNYVCATTGWVVNGGIGGIGVKGLKDNIAGIIAQAQPSVATLMVGTNDANAGLVGTPDDLAWETNYTALVDALVAAGVTPTLFYRAAG